VKKNLITLESQIADSTVALRCDASCQEHGEWVLASLAERAESGWTPRGGLRIEFGWSVLSLIGQNNTYVVHEPDFDNDPTSWVRDEVTTSLLVQADMLGIAAAVDVEPVFPNFADRVLVKEGWLEAHKVSLFRGIDPRLAESKWMINHDDADEATPTDTIRVFELLKLRRSLLSALALPPGYLAVFEGDQMTGYGAPH
jgi:hypothetical protein